MAELLKNIFIILTYPITLLIIILYLILTIPIFLIRWLISQAILWYNPELEEVVRHLDGFLAGDNIYGDNPINLITTTKFNGSLSAEYLRERGMERAINAVSEKDGLPLFPQLTRYYTYVMGIPFWKEAKDFKIENHVFELQGM